VAGPSREGEFIGGTTRRADHVTDEAERGGGAAGHTASGHQEGHDFVAVSCSPLLDKIVEQQDRSAGVAGLLHRQDRAPKQARHVLLQDLREGMLS
jgi:hypothetical protein